MFVGLDKKKTGLDNLDLFTYVSEIKGPDWLPFNLTWPIPKFYLPKINLREINRINDSLKSSSFETLFWYYLMKRYLNLLKIDPDNKIYELILKSEVDNGDSVGFRQNTYHLWNHENKKKSNIIMARLLQ